jgi:hypothetical protein
MYVSVVRSDVVLDCHSPRTTPRTLTTTTYVASYLLVATTVLTAGNNAVALALFGHLKIPKREAQYVVAVMVCLPSGRSSRLQLSVLLGSTMGGASPGGQATSLLHASAA